jgi:PAS domain S-box-containing protein
MVMANYIQEINNLDKEIITSILENVPGVITVYDIDVNEHRKLIYLSPGFDDIVGEHTAAKINNDPNIFFQLIDPDYTDLLENAARKAIKENRILDFIYPVFSDTGKSWIRVQLNWKFLNNNKIIRWYGLISDVTKQVSNKESLIRKREYLHNLIEEASDLIWENDVTGKYLAINKSFSKVMGYELKEVIGKNSLDFIHPDDKEISKKHFQKALEGKRASYETRCISSSNKILHFWVKLRPIYKAQQLIAIQGIGRDITERIKAQEIRNITYNITEKLSDIDNLAEFAEIIRIQLSKIMNTENFYLALYDEKLDRYTFPYYKDTTETIDPNMVYAMHNTITNYVRKNAFPVLLNSQNQQTFLEKNKISLIGTVAPCWIGAPIMDKSRKKAIGVLVVQSYDNSDEYNLEDLKALDFVALNMGRLIIRKMNEIKQKNVNDQLSLITKILRHDLTNDLVVIKSALNLYDKSGDKTFLKEAHDKVLKGIELINQMRDQEDFASENRNLAPYKVQDVLKKVITEYKNCQIIFSGKGKIFADQSIFSIFHNIISNAILHGKADKIDIAIKSEGRKCIISVTNNGLMIPNNITHRIFEEGFSDKNNSTGMGLYLISKTLENYHGSIFLEKNKPSKVCFTLIFPKAISR